MASSLKPLRSDGVDAALSAAAREAHRLEGVSYYNSLLERQNLSEFALNLQEQMKNRGAYFGERLICPFLRPHFCGREQLDLLNSAVRGVVGACNVLGPRIRSFARNARCHRSFRRRASPVRRGSRLSRIFGHLSPG